MRVAAWIAGAVAVVVLGAVLAVVLWPEQKTDGAATSVAADPAGPTPDSHESEITTMLGRYVEAVNNGDSALFRSTLCARVLERESVDGDTAPLENGRYQLDSVSEVQVTGDTAYAMVQISVEDDPDASAERARMYFVNEGGWKLCRE